MEVLAVNRKLLMELEKKIKSCPEEEFSNLRIGHLFLDIVRRFTLSKVMSAPNGV